MIAILVEETAFAWRETRGVRPNAAADAVHPAMRRLALRYHPDRGGAEAQTTWINATYAEATTARENRQLVEDRAPRRP